MAKKKYNTPQREERVPQREGYRYSGNPDDVPEVNKDKPMVQVPLVKTPIPLRREDVRVPDAMPRVVSREEPSPAVSEGVIDKMHLPSMNHVPDAMSQKYSSEVPSDTVGRGMYDASPQRAMNHGADAMPSLAKGDVPTGGATAQASAPVSAAPNIFTSGGVRGAFEPTEGSTSTFTAPVNWEEAGKRQPIGWTQDGKPVYEWDGYDEDKRPPLTTATEQAYDPILKGKPGEVEVDKSGGRGKPVFQKDPEKKDGGFMKWLGGLFKTRNGKREGETDDEYDERMTRNQMRIMTVANALRHMANLYYTSKGGVPQQFNDPNAELKKGLAERKAERAQKASLAAAQAYKDAQLQLQQDKNDTDKAYRQMSLYYKGRDADRADDRLAWEKDKDKQTRDRWSRNDAWEHNFKDKQQKANERYQRGRLAAEGKKAKAAMLRATNGGGGSTGNMVNLATPKGHLNRKKELSVYEEKQIFNFMRKNGNLTKEFIAKYDALPPEEKRAAMQSAISYAASDPSKGGQRMREYLKKHHNYSEVATSAVGELDFD